MKCSEQKLNRNLAENKDFGFYAAEIRKAEAEGKKFEQVAGVPFTINNARHALLNAADSAMVYFHNDCDNPNCDEFKNQFHKILRALPKKSLPDISNLIQTEILAHLRLNYGDLPVAWLTDKF